MNNARHVSISGNEDLAGEGFFEAAPEFGKAVGWPALKGVFGAGMDGDPATWAGREELVGLEEKGEGLDGGGGAEVLGDLQAAGDLVLGVVMLWQSALHTRYDTAGSMGLKFLAAQSCPHLTHLS